jgi:DNA polymerase elongation subunit (family B)
MRDLKKDYVPIEKIPEIPNLFSDIKPIESLTLVVIDIETSGLEPHTDRVYNIGVWVKGDFINIDDRDERTLLYNFSLLAWTFGDCVIVGHNIFQFDLPFLLTRASVYGIQLPFGYRIARDGSRITRNVRTAVHIFMDNKFDEITWNRKDVSIVDTYILAGLLDSQYLFESKSLKQLPVILGCRTEPRIELSVHQIREIWAKNDDDNRIEEYLKWDLIDNRDIFYKLIPSFYYMQSFLHMTLQEIVLSSTAKKVESFLKNYYRGEYREPDIKRPYPGAYTAARKGLYFNVVKADVASQYPYIMLAYRLGPGFDKDPCGYFWSLLLTLRNKRIEYKRSGVPEKIQISNAMKIIINSCYGLLGADHHDYNNMDAAAAVTEYGRLIVSTMMRIINANGGTIIEVDTDGVMFTCPDAGIFDKMHAEMPPGLEIENELTTDWLYIAGAKNYIYSSNGKLTKKGFFRKRNTIKLKTHFIIEFLKLWVAHGESAAVLFYKSLRDDITYYRLPVEYVRSKRKIGKAEVAALAYGNVGDEIHDYYGYDAGGRVGKVISGLYNSHYYMRELDSWFNELYSNITTLNELEEGQA